MYSDEIKVANKIITYDALYEIFSKMQEKLVQYKKVYDSEEIQNRVLDYRYQNWTFKDTGSKLQFDVNFYDDTSIKFDNYNNFISIFNSRLDDIKSIYVYFSLSYNTQTEGGDNGWYSQHISMWIYEDKMNIDVSLNSEDKKIDDIYELIKSKINSAPVKYDEVIKRKKGINATVGMAIGFIPALVITILLIFVPGVRHAYAVSYILFPVGVLIMAFLLGGMIGSNMLDKFYKNIVPEQKYAGYDKNNYTSIYTDDIDKYVTTSEILIGKNADNLKCRKEIMEYYKKYKKFIPYELGVMLLFSIIVLFLGNI